MRWVATIATNQVDQDGEQFSDAALVQIAAQAATTPISWNFARLKIGSVQKAAHDGGAVSIEAETGGMIPYGIYAVPKIAFDPNDCTEENGVRVYHRITLISIGLTHNPSDTHLTPIHEV